MLGWHLFVYLHKDQSKMNMLEWSQFDILICLFKCNELMMRECFVIRLNSNLDPMMAK